jgi:hypothetical protein
MMMNDIRKYFIARTPHQKRAFIEAVKEMPADPAPPMVHRLQIAARDLVTYWDFSPADVRTILGYGVQAGIEWSRTEPDGG